MSATQTKGMGQQYGDCTVGVARSQQETQVLEVTAWDFEPAQKLGGVVTNATGGFEGQVPGAISGKGKVTVLVPKTGYGVPLLCGADVILNLYADRERSHGFANIYASLESAPVAIDLSSDKGIEITFNFKSDGHFIPIGAFTIFGNGILIIPL